METIVINQIKDQSYTMKESLRALKTSISFSGKGVKSILFTSSVPNEGKTTVVMDLARSMADSRVLKIVVTDTDLEASKTVADEIAKVSSQYIADNMDQSQPKIIQTAYASKTPVNNNILKNTVIGAVLGLFLATGIVVLGYMLDDTISNADDMETRTGLKVLASLPVDETEYDGAKTKRRKKKKTQSSKSDDSKSKKRAV